MESHFPDFDNERNCEKKNFHLITQGQIKKKDLVTLNGLIIFNQFGNRCAV